MGSSKIKFIAAAAGLTIVFWAIYFKSLFTGYQTDDLRDFILKLSWEEWLRNPFMTDLGRPIWGLNYLLTGEISVSPFFQRSINLCLLSIIIWIFVSYLYKMKLPLSSCLFLAAALSHPSFIWPITWIAQRCDLLLILFTGLCLITFANRWSVIALILASGAKTPFVFQNLFFAWKYFRSGRHFSGAVAVFLVPLFIYAGYVTYYAKNWAYPVKHGLYAVGRHDVLFALIAVAVRGVKALEGIFYTFVPLGAFAVSSAHVAIVGCILLTAWSSILYEVVRSCRYNGGITLKSALFDHPWVDLIAIGLLMSLGYGFGTGLRIYAPGVIFFFLAIAATAPVTKRVIVAIAVVIGIYLYGIYLNYNATASHCFSLSDYWEECKGPPVPDDNWEEWRQSIVDVILIKHLK
jgi:hypothetical protein